MWISNPDNDITGNIVADTESAGFWLAFSYRPFGLSSNAKVPVPADPPVVPVELHPMRPFWMKLSLFEDNVSFSNKFEGFFLDLPEIDPCTGAVGNILSGDALDEVTESVEQFTNSTPGDIHFTDYRPYEEDLFGTGEDEFTILRCATWKNNLHGFWNRSEGIQLQRIVSADNSGRYFAGDTLRGDIFESLVIQDTLNNPPGSNPAPRPQTHPEYYPCGFATYHSGADVHRNLVAGFVESAGQNSGAFATDDYYLIPVEKGHARNFDNELVNCEPGWRLQRLDTDYALTGALWDPHGTWSGQANCDTYLVYNDPFFASSDPQVIETPQSGGLLTPGPFYGFNDFRITPPGEDPNVDLEDYHKLTVTRTPGSMGTEPGLGVPIGTWTIDQDKGTAIHNVLAYLRHFVTHPSDDYKLEFPDFGPGAGEWIFDLGMRISNFRSPADVQILGVPFHGTNVQEVYTSTAYNYYPSFAPKNFYSGTKDLNVFLAQPADQPYYWHDTNAGVVWVRIVGQGTGGCDLQDIKDDTDEELYADMGLRVWGN